VRYGYGDKTETLAENLDGAAPPNTAPVAGYQAALATLGLSGAGVTIGIVDTGVGGGRKHGPGMSRSDVDYIPDCDCGGAWECYGCGQPLRRKLAPATSIPNVWGAPDVRQYLGAIRDRTPYEVRFPLGPRGGALMTWATTASKYTCRGRTSSVDSCRSCRCRWTA
jgi:hypothetical protein